MKLLMKQDVNAAPDHINVCFYQSGQVYDHTTTPALSADLEEIFIKEGWAEEVREGPAAAAASFSPPAPADKPKA